ncbi:hypothetical protein DACRYDRAFT_107814 [Dacryopinax primogenitus]|uniref:Uncharacterized protein n=1 Tax=Dacryopinax primogenitus (strain DJM 731) TaxID=1858805 RepID=M5GBA1_DACPD|nr:uncharacterized protein DACRYDRAFT_107814 [Dacryopinax primogenitus]EJU01258.1 hypothetical protein DACRYDRAFT_107814 [Dacryopinax primogenitus]
MLFFHRKTQSEVTARLDKLKSGEDIPKAVDIISKYIDSKRRRGKRDAYVVGKLERLETTRSYMEHSVLLAIELHSPHWQATSCQTGAKPNCAPLPDWWHPMHSLPESDSPAFVVEYPSNPDPKPLLADDTAKRPARPSRQESPPGAFLGTPASIGTIYMNGGSLTSSPAPLSINSVPPENPGPARPPNRQSIQGSTISEGTVYRYGGSVHSSYPSPDVPAQPSSQVRNDSQPVQAPGRMRTNGYALPVEPGQGGTLASATLPLTGIPLPLTGIPLPLTGVPLTLTGIPLPLSGIPGANPRSTPLQPLQDITDAPSPDHIPDDAPSSPIFVSREPAFQHSTEPSNSERVSRTLGRLTSVNNESPEQDFPPPIASTPPSVDSEHRSASPNGSENYSDTILESGGSLKDEEEVPDVRDV